MIKFKPLQDGDVIETSANIDLLKNWIGFTHQILKLKLD